MDGVDRRRTRLGVAASVGQTLVSGLALFGLYGYVRVQLGLEVFGVWSVVVGTALTAQVAGLGLAGSAVKFVAAALAQDDADEAARVSDTTVLAVAVLVGAACVPLYPALRALLPLIVQEEALLEVALLLLPYALGALWLSAAANAALSCLAGASRVHWQASLAMLGSVAYLGLAVALTPRLGVIGLAWAQVIYNALVLVAGWGLVRRVLPRAGRVPHRFDGPLLRRMVGYGVGFQSISILFLLVEPVAKAFVMRFGGAVWAGNFELANKLALQLRSLIVSGHQALVPMLAAVHERTPEQLTGVYRSSLRVVVTLVALMLPPVVAAAPLVSLLWLGRVDTLFVAMLGVLLVTWFGNALSGPAYFHYLGSGVLRWNVAGELVKGVVNTALGFALGLAVGGAGAVLGYALGLAAGSAVPVWAFHRERHVERLPAADAWLVGAGVLLLPLLLAASYAALAGGAYLLFGLTLALATAWTLVGGWRRLLRPGGLLPRLALTS